MIIYDNEANALIRRIIASDQYDSEIAKNALQTLCEISKTGTIDPEVLHRLQVETQHLTN